MKLIKEKYRKLKPKAEYLKDEVIVAQAWKKSHGYIRRHNWYADPLALDLSALSLEINTELWSKLQNYTPRPLELVPAAKSCNWTTKEGWKPCTEQKIRPLAHILVREQTMATALMMCMADAVETVQGNCDIKGASFFEAQRRGVFSYGNRLLCDWDKGGAWFRWGNSETYRKFFSDYQAFLRRPVEIGRDVANSHIGQENVFVVSLDIAGFYDCIDRSLLLKRLKGICSGFYREEADPQFWQIASEIIDWKWDEVVAERGTELGLELTNKGLPQGLVAAGFLANAYLVDFDAKVGGALGKPLSGCPDVILHDYCRYVDDIRLVVSIDEGVLSESPDKLRDRVAAWLSSLLCSYGHGELKFNDDKAKITALPDLDAKGSLSSRLALIQGELSGPADRDLLDNTMGILEGLLSAQSNEGNIGETDPTYDLFGLTKFDHDIQEGTLKRFSANRLERIIRDKRRLTVIDEKSDAEQETTDNEAELLSKKLIWVWMQDPSLALVLRKALEIFPSSEFLEPVLKAIFSKTKWADGEQNYAVSAAMEYLLADVFRFCIEFNGFQENRHYPENARPEEMQEVAARWAQKIVSIPQAPTFLLRQALLLLAALKKVVVPSHNAPALHIRLHQILAGQKLTYDPQALALFEVAGQITGNWQTLACQMLEHLYETSSRALWEDLEPFAKRGGDFWFALWKQLKQDPITASKLQWAAPVGSAVPKPIQQRLARVIGSEQNGFVHEIALVKLALGLVELALEHPDRIPLSPSQMSVSQNQKGKLPWSDIWNLKVHEINCYHNNHKQTNDPRFAFPPWVDNRKADAAAIYWIGSILRAAAIGQADYTSNRWHSSKTRNYKGLRTNWFKRRMGMMHSPEVLVGEYATASSWASELIMTCLQWPGFETSHIQHTDIANIDDLKGLNEVLEQRKTYLEGLHCKASDLPLLPTLVRHPKREHDRFRIVSVQQLLPRTDDFTIGDLTLDAPKKRAKNRAQLAKICQLIQKTLEAQAVANDEGQNCEADLIVFPEVAVHQDDQDLLERLADKTRAIIFAGLVFIDDGKKLVNRARWLIPDYRQTGRQWIIRDQGKSFMTKIEKKLGIQPDRPCQHLLEIIGRDGASIRIAGAICYDATDLNLVADLKGKSDLFVICAHNKDVRTFDAMASALHYHMYQHVVVVNKGEFGGSTIQAPFAQQFDRLISHAHGTQQISINIADLDLEAFKRDHYNFKAVKYPPAGKS